MITYREIATKDDVAFHRVARKVLKSEYGNAVAEANDAFGKAFNAGSVTSRINDARRAANLIILDWLSDYGVTQWRSDTQPKTKQKLIKGSRDNFVSETVKNRVFKSDNGLWSKNIN